VDVGHYLRRIGLAQAPAPRLDGLAELGLAHLYAVPFENLDIAAGRPLSLDPETLFDKLVVRRRGGFCYELNGLFAALLRELGFEVTLLAGQTVDPVDGSPGPERAHLVLRVDLDRPWLVDVGWGEAYRRPLALRDGAEHVDPAIGSYRLAERDGRWELVELLEPEGTARDVHVRIAQDAEWRVAYRFDLHPHELADFDATCRWQQSESPFFTRHRFCTVATPTGRRTLMDDRLILREGSSRTERPVAEDEVPVLLEQLFGVRDALI
jgi:N-hydroxyarylamine O-acetyltransferase